MVASAPAIDQTLFEKVPLTGTTLDAAMKMRCDFTGASYAIYWANADGKLVVAADYVTDARRAVNRAVGREGTFAESSEGFALDADGEGPIADVMRTGQPQFVVDPARSKMTRRDLAEKYGIAAMAFFPFEGGVLEIGTTDSYESAEWRELPSITRLPHADMRRAYEKFGASYTMVWKRTADQYRVVADHTTSARKLALQKARSDDRTFCSESRNIAAEAQGDNVLAHTVQSGTETVIDDPSQMRRAALAREFGVKKLHLVPFVDAETGESLVLEYGTPTDVYLEGARLEATLKMAVESTGAAYALYWKSVGETLTCAGTYLSPARRFENIVTGVSDVGDEFYVKESETLTISGLGDSPIANVLHTDTPHFVEDAAACPSIIRRDAARRSGVKSICYVPVEGGVLEFGNTFTDCTVDWPSVEAAGFADLPISEMKEAFASGATHMIYWKYFGSSFKCAADYVIPEQLRALRQYRGDEKSYTSESEQYIIDANGLGPCATAYRVGKSIVIEDAASAVSFQRAALAREFGVGNLHFVPTADGVLEYGVASFNRPVF